ncbi:LTA synthase family protein [Ferruginibacter sp.]
MVFLERIPRLLRWIFSIVLLLLFTMTVFRFIFYFKYNPPGKAFSGSAFIMGLRFDARIACIVGLAVLILTFIPFLNPFKNAGAKKFWNFLLPLAFTILVFFYFVDFYHFDYLHQRLNASVLNYLQDAGISWQMMWQTYPLVKVTIAIIVLVLAARFIFGRLLQSYITKDSFYKRKGVLLYIISFLLLAQIIIGKIVVMSGQFPLRWSDAFTLKGDFEANLALNPFQSFFSTLSFRHSTYDIKKVKEDYALMSSYLGVQNPDSSTLNYERKYTFTDSSKRPNVVLVICESFSAYKSSMYNNPLNTTPYFNELCNNGIFFDRCFTPAYGTARGVWATITGIPDVESPSTASRNPNAVNQHTIINDFNNYEHYYFLGGSATWANIRGLLTNNINGLHLYEEQDYKANKIDVWGISDKNLFLEANKVLKEQNKPFFAVIQTADNHRPYTIPAEDDAAFNKVSFSTDSLKRFGFESNDEMNAFRYTDFCYQQFMEAAKKEPYFGNTVFVFVGDHGIRFNGTLEYFPKSWTEQGLSCEHVPLLFYAPKLLQPKKIHEVCSQADVLPTIAAITKTPYRNNTFGRNLVDTFVPLSEYKSIQRGEKYAFVIDHDVRTIGLVSDEYYFLKNLKTGKEDFVSMLNNNPVEKNAHTDSVRNYLSRLTDAYYETSKYLLLNNKKK